MAIDLTVQAGAFRAARPLLALSGRGPQRTDVDSVTKLHIMLDNRFYSSLSLSLCLCPLFSGGIILSGRSLGAQAN